MNAWSGRWRPPRSLRAQIIVSTVAVTAFAMVLLTVLVQLVLSEVNDRGVDTVLEDRADAVVATIEGGAEPGSVRSLRSLEVDDGVVVFDADGRRLVGAAPAGADAEVDALGRSTRGRYRDAGDDLRLFAEPFDRGDGGVVVLSEGLAPYERAETYALVASIALGAVVTAGAGAVAAWVMHRALGPVAQMAARADDWSEHDLGRRFELGEPSTELATLGATLDHLLDRVARAIGAEQRLTSELAHELRTPLTTVHATAQLLLLRDDLDAATRVDVEQIDDSCRQMAQTIRTLLDLARSGRGAASDSVSASDLLDLVASGHPTDAVHVLVDRVDPAPGVALPLALAARALQPVVDNAVRHAARQVRLAVSTDGADVVISVVDDGPGFPGPEVDVFEPGVAVGDHGGTGLGLALARRVARSVGGDVTAARQVGGRAGAHVDVRLPASRS